MYHLFICRNYQWLPIPSFSPQSLKWANKMGFKRKLQFLGISVISKLMKCIPKGKGVLRVIDRKMDGDKVFYLMAKGKWRKWVDFEDLNDHLQLVIQFEEKLKKKVKESEENEKMGVQPDPSQFTQKIQQMRKEAKVKHCEQGPVSNIVFLNIVEKQFFFRVFYDGGKEEVMNSQQLRLKHPQELITFYENNVEVEPLNSAMGSK